jgi:replicative DNA helicase
MTLSAPTELSFHAIEAEQALIGVVLSHPGSIRDAAAIRAEHFFEPLHGRLWRAFADAHTAGRTINQALVAGPFRNDQSLIELGGQRYLANLLDHAPEPSAIPDLASDIVAAWSKRALWDRCKAAESSLLTDDRPPVAHLSSLRSDLEVIEREACAPDDGLISAVQAGADLADALDREAVDGRERGYMCGLRSIDRRMRGLRPGWQIVIGGRPSMGKTAYARSILYGAAVRNPTVLFIMFALEMDRREITERAVSAASWLDGDGVPYVEMGGKDLQREDRQRLRTLAQHLPTNLLIDDHPSLSVDDVRRRIWAQKRKGPVGAVVIDYLQLMTRPAAQGRNEASVIGEMTSALKRIAKETAVCIILLSQLSRGVESRDDKRPQLSDLRESGSIEQDANAVLFPFRAVYYTERAEPVGGSKEWDAWTIKVEVERRRMDVIAAKVRGGAIGTDRQTCWIEYDHIEDTLEAA